MAGSPATADSCHFANLPYELRQRIFSYALQQKGTIGMQTPIWDNGSAFTQPLFAVCRSFRDEALEAFYKTNTFVWHVHRPQNPSEVCASPDSRPSEYPLDLPEPGHTLTLTPSLPWHYPRLLKELRHLIINVFLPSDLDPDAWATTFPQQLRALVTALDRGSRLSELQVSIITGHWRNGRLLPSVHLQTLDILSKMRVAGSVRVRLRPSTGPCATSVTALGLEGKIKA